MFFIFNKELRKENKRLDIPKASLEQDCPHNYVAEVLDNPDDVASATGATGMIPTPPQDAAQAESYQALYAIPQQVQQIQPPIEPPSEA